jgi:4-amino-4-deoxy-L-arabinose transferase-like glycosyltransferase
MGVGTVALAYDLTRRVFGRPAGFVAGLVLALTPITVAISRHNNPDALVVLASTAALWFTVRACLDGRTRWLVWAGVMVGIGFEAKMATGLLVLPASVVAYLWVAPRGRVAAVRQLVVAGVVTAAVSLAWPVLVWLTPAADRPWVSGTSDNSIWSLILDYNGAGRVEGQAGGPGGGFGGGGGGGVFGGDTGITRLVDASLGGQAGWLVGMAVVGGLAIAVLTRLRRTDPRTGWILAAGGAFATCAVVFSYAKGIFHPTTCRCSRRSRRCSSARRRGRSSRAGSPRGSSRRWRCWPGWGPRSWSSTAARATSRAWSRWRSSRPRAARRRSSPGRRRPCAAWRWRSRSARC